MRLPPASINVCPYSGCVCSNNFKKIEIFSAEGSELENNSRTPKNEAALLWWLPPQIVARSKPNFEGPGRYAGWHWFKDVLDWKN
jgi:hypothetical protein